MNEQRAGAKATVAVIGMAVPLLLGLPLLGIVLTGGPVTPYLEFPPLTRYVEHAGFSWVAFTLMAAFVAACVLPFVITVRRNQTRRDAATRTSFPRWGVAGIMLTLFAWFIAWTRLPWMASVQTHTFIPLWLGYIVTVNACTYSRSGRSPLTDETRFYLALFPMSALFWWFFEYLNRFVQNWHYVGIEAFTPLEYLFWASLAFSTVLPAVYATHSLVATWPGFRAGLDRGWRLRLPRRAAPPVLILTAVALLAIGIWPTWTYPMLWLAPFAIIVALQIYRGQSTILAPLARGDWHGIWLWALAALVCGVFWETWNFLSAAKWIYSVPLVHRFEIFEMPLLGYAGYLPFGLECALAVDLAARFCSPPHSPVRDQAGA